MRIVFMGTPDFAVESLKAILENTNHSIVGVITAPDKPAGRGKKLQPSAVKTYAEANGLNVLQPTNLKATEFVEELKSLQADLQVVVAFRMLPEVVWNMPEHGTINVHASLLPQYRGAAPINWAIINNEQKSGVTTFLLQHEIDTGNILLQQEVGITSHMTAGDLHNKLMYAGAELLVKTVEQIASGTTAPVPQEDIAVDELKSAPKIFKDTCRVNWNNSNKAVHNLIRGLSPYPGAWTTIKEGEKETTLKLFKTEPIDEQLAIGEIKTNNKTYITIGCATGALSITELQLAGKKRMKTEDLLRGYNFSTAAKLN